MTLETSIALAVKLLTLTGLGLYIVFALIMVRQEQLMAHVLEEAFEPVLRALVVLHAIAAAAVFFLALVLL
jgi:hypothetical protein